jgi:uncharacterized protein (TIGR03437 family)
VGLKSPVLHSIGFLLISSSVLAAAPVLRLSTATIGPLALASAGVTNTQTVEVFNAGDGSLNPSVASSASWVTTSAGASRPCRAILTAVGQTCSTLQVTVNTAGLPQGTSTAVLTVSDPNAVDAPQTITVTVRIGAVNIDVAPGGARDVPFTTSSFVLTTPTTQSGGNWLSVVTDAFGSFRFNYPYRIQFQPAADLAQGAYAGSVAISGGSNPADNTTLPVSMRVTTLPIAVPSTEKLVVRLAEGSPALQYPFSPIVTISNAGQGALTVSDTSVTGGNWISKDVVAGFFKIDPAGLPVGTNTGSIVFTSNAVNGTVTVPVELQIVAKAQPTILFQGVANNVTFDATEIVAQGDIMIVKGEQLSLDKFTQAQSVPLPRKLGGTAVLVNGVATPLYYTSYGQIAFQMPVETPIGTAIVQVQRDDNPNASNKASVQVAPRAPRLQVVSDVNYKVNTASNPARVGQAVIVWSIGFGATSPAVATGAAGPAAEPLARVTPTPMVSLGNGINKLTFAPYFAGLSPEFPGSYQVIVIIPEDSPKGEIDLVISVAEFASNPLKIYVQ